MCNGQLIEIIKKRRSIRRYKPDPPPEEWIEEIIKATIWAPSPSNLQPVRFVRIDSKGLLNKIQKEIEKGKERLLKRLISEKIKKRVNLYYERYCKFMFDAPIIFVVGIKSEKQSLFEKIKEEGLKVSYYNENFAMEISLGISVSYFLLKAEELGLGTCVLTSPFLFIENINHIIGIKDITFRCFITLGFPDESPLPPERIPVSEVYMLAR